MHHPSSLILLPCGSRRSGITTPVGAERKKKIRPEVDGEHMEAAVSSPGVCVLFVVYIRKQEKNQSWSLEY